MSITKNILRSPLVRGLALVAVLGGTATAGGSSFNEYDVTGTVKYGSRGVEVRGELRFEIDGSAMEVEFLPTALRGAEISGLYEEIDLFFFSLWSFEGAGSSDGGNEVSGLGIRLFFGLLVFGTFVDEVEGDTFSFSGIIDGVAGAARHNGFPARVTSSPGMMEHTALLRRRSLAQGVRSYS